MEPLSGAATDRKIGRLHVLTDVFLQQRYGHLEVARLALAGGAEVIQLREKRPLPEAELIALARAVALECERRGARCVVNDHVEVARAAGAGVHVGRGDPEPEHARRVLGPAALVGVTVHDMDELRTAVAGPADYLGVGPVFGTTSKETGLPALGLEGLASLVRATSLPVIAIGGITPERVASVIAAGAHGVAVLGGVCLAEDPVRATAAYRDELRRAVGDERAP
jgi:thiamine-phosphate pyrophosphorylase